MNTQNHEHLFAAQKQMAEALTELESLKDKAGMASQICDFANDRRKSALAQFIIPHLKDNSFAAAEMMARNELQYKNEMKRIMQETSSADGVLKSFQIAKLKFEAARSVLSVEKSLLNL